VAAKIQLKITTPTGTKFSQEVDEFTAPSVSGEFGVLPAHRPLLAALKTGLISYRIGNEETKVAVGPGFVKVENDEAEVLTESFISKADVDPIVARRDLKVSEEELNKLNPQSDEQTIKSVIRTTRWAATCLELYGDPPPPMLVLAHEIRLLSEKANYRDFEGPEASDQAS